MRKIHPRMTCDEVYVQIDRKNAMFTAACTVAGVQAGKLSVWRIRESGHTVMSVTNAIVGHSYRRRGVGTQLYEAAAATACQDFGLPLASDRHTSRSRLVEPFWKKQKRKGRAVCIGDSGAKRCRMFMLSCPAPASLVGRR